MWSFFHKLGSPRWFYQISGQWLPWLSALTAILFVTGITWGLLYAPPDFRQGNSYRIMYIHVPSAIVSQFGYVVMASAAAVSLIWKMKVAEIAMKCAAVPGAALTFMALVTGSIWGKPTWGTWWVWDVRIISVLVMLFLYMGVIALYEAFENKESAVKACGVLSLVGVVNLPIIKLSVYLWHSLHQPASLKLVGESAIAAPMRYPLLIMMVGFLCFFAVVLMLRMRNEILQRERTTKWVRELVLGRPVEA